MTAEGAGKTGWGGMASLLGSELHSGRLFGGLLDLTFYCTP